MNPISHDGEMGFCCFEEKNIEMIDRWLAVIVLEMSRSILTRIHKVSVNFSSTSSLLFL